MLLRELRIPHSFFNYIFLNQTKYNTDAIPKEVILHEETHAKQLHSLDIMAIELLQIVFWFHPLVYILKHHIKLNHEFLADQAVLNNGIAPKIYQHILLQFSSNTPNNQLSSAINYSSIKKRFTVMKTQTSKTKIWLSSLILLPIIAILFYSFSSKKYVEKELEVSSALIESAEKITTNDLQKLAEENHYTKRYFKFKDEKGISSELRFNDLDYKNKKRWLYTEPIPFSEKNISEKEFKNFKTKDSYVIKVNGNDIENLSDYNRENFITYSVTPISELANMKEQFVLNLVTEDVFQTNLEQSISMYKMVLDNYEKEYDAKIETNTTEFVSTYEFLNDTYKRFTAEIIEQNNLIAPREISQEIIKITYQSLLNIPVLYIDLNNNLFLNKNPTSLKTIKNDFNEVTNFTRNSISLQTEGRSVHREFLDEIALAIGENLKAISLASGQTQLYDPNYNIKKTKKSQQDLPTAKQIADFNSWAKKINGETKILSEKAVWYPPTDSKNLVEFDGIYQRMTVKQKENSAKFPYDDTILKNAKLEFQKTATYSAQQDIPSTKEIAAYNTWAKKITTQINKAEKDKSNEYPIIKLKDLERFKSIYSRMTKEQKENAKSFPDISKIPIIKPHPGYKKRPNTNDTPKSKQVAEYNTWAKKTKEKYKTLPESHKIEGFPIMDKKVFNYYNSIYKRMSAQQLKNAESFPEAAIAPPPPPPPPPSHNGKVSKSMVNIYNQWIKGLKNTDGTYNIITKEDYTYYISIYNNMTEEQKKNSAGLPPPPPPPSAPKSKQNKEEEREIPAPPPPPIPENVSPVERSRMINVTEAYAKKHPESVTKAKIGGKIVDVVEMPMDDEGTTEIFAKKYKYIIKDGITTYFDSKNKKYTEDEFKKHIRTIEDNLKETKRSKNDKGGPNANIQKGLSFTFSSLKNAKKIDWDLKKAFEEEFNELNKGDSIRVVLEIDDNVMIDNKIIREYKSEFKGTFGKTDIMYEKIKNHIKELNSKK